jgi:hypothetical protein
MEHIPTDIEHLPNQPDMKKARHTPPTAPDPAPFLPDSIYFVTMSTDSSFVCIWCWALVKSGDRAGYLYELLQGAHEHGNLGWVIDWIEVGGQMDGRACVPDGFGLVDREDIPLKVVYRGAGPLPLKKLKGDEVWLFPPSELMLERAAKALAWAGGSHAALKIPHRAMWVRLLTNPKD